MAQYIVKKIDLSNVKTVDEYQNAVKKATIQYCNNLKEVETYCGGKLHRQRAGYSGMCGNVEYIATKISNN